MISELLHNKLFLISAGLFAVFIFYKIFFRKDKFTENLENEYNEILNSDKYKVRGQYD